MSRPRPGGQLDWRLAGTVGATLARPGPPTTDYTRRQVIGDLAAASRRAELPVREVTGLSTPGSAPGSAPEARIVDRREWIRAAAESVGVMSGGSAGPGGAISGRLAGAQAGAVLAFVSSGILGQFDPFAGASGELLLVYPNVIAAERQLRVPPQDFRLWVCLHEVTHRVQFTANPWLSDYMARTLAIVTDGRGDDISAVAGRLAGLVKDRRGLSGQSGNPGDSGILGVLRAVVSPEQRDALDGLLALGTLLEGHADHVMDAVGPSVVPSVQLIRSRFEDRRHRRQRPLQRLLRALLGVDAKLDQYTRGKAFVDDVVGRVGMERFNAVWTAPGTLPLLNEIGEPQRWIDRVL